MQQHTKKSSSKKIILIVSAAIVIILALLIVLVVALNNGKRTDKSVISNSETKNTESEFDGESDKAGKKEDEDLEGESAEKSSDDTTEKTTDETTEVNIVERDYTLMICVPTDELSLRNVPGINDSVITKLTCGTKVQWRGENVTVGEDLFYKVKVESTGEEGYVMAEYCTPVEFECDESKLGIVEINNNLYTYNMMVDDIKTLCKKYSDVLQYKVIGKSLDGRDIYEVVFGNKEAEHHIFAQSTVHGREYMNSQLVMRMLEYYSAYYKEGYYNGVSYQELFKNVAVHIVPMANPDGVTLCQEGINSIKNSSYRDLIRQCYERDKWTMEYKQDSLGDMNWADYYKDKEYIRDSAAALITFDEYLKQWKANAEGVDINRNFDSGWDTIAQKTEPAYTDFKGYSPDSEPETKCLIKLAKERNYDYFISYHSKGNLIYYDVAGNSASNSIASTEFANLMQTVIRYKPKQTAQSENVVLGGFGDWVQLTLNKPSITIESGRHPCPLEISEFNSIWNRHRESWALLASELYE